MNMMRNVAIRLSGASHALVVAPEHRVGRTLHQMIMDGFAHSSGVDGEWGILSSHVSRHVVVVPVESPPHPDASSASSTEGAQYVINSHLLNIPLIVAADMPPFDEQIVGHEYTMELYYATLAAAQYRIVTLPRVSITAATALAHSSVAIFTEKVGLCCFLFDVFYIYLFCDSCC